MQQITPAQVPADAQLIDVREPEEFAAGHAAGAVNVPLGDVPARWREFNQDETVYIICQSGGRSARACQWLEQSVGVEATNVDGGTSAWAAAGLPMS
ncbi:rhodanese-like domain-containing protein [Corynebacterium mendelii]|uniref:Rhodanese-like domain-containing protein n=1 Tax=Corynebacterium mendelii TaxID=2765362 RepID=A0A939E179_9CORY|nr:rhodanese-like domain-containing protein [Corynebacterium mendelii]MBN9645100.1 rhodanese-like domain-containing protein [Corynebacterium mendelii]